MARFRSGPAAWWWQALPVLLALVLVARQLVGKWPFNAIWGIREDDFWAFSGGHVRRGLLGEILYQGASLFGSGVVAATAVVFLLVYGLAAWRIARLLDLQSNWRWFWPLVLSAIYFNYAVDREVLLLLPFFVVHSWQSAGATRRCAFLATVLTLCFVHEFALLLYGPLLAVLIMQERDAHARRLLLVGLAALVLVGAVLIGLKSTPTLELEKTFWPLHGIHGLERANLYVFASMPLDKVLHLHATMLDTPSGRWVLVFQGCLALLLVCWFWSSKPFCIAVLGWMVPASVLSIDYGRYAYLTFFAFILAWYHLGPGQGWRSLPRQRGALILAAALLLASMPNSFCAGAEPARVSIKRELDLLQRLQESVFKRLAAV